MNIRSVFHKIVKNDIGNQADIDVNIGQSLTNASEEIIKEFELLGWYLFPIEAQRLLPTILIIVQEPIAVGCFGIIVASRDQFKKANSNQCDIKLY